MPISEIEYLAKLDDFVTDTKLFQLYNFSRPDNVLF